MLNLIIATWVAVSCVTGRSSVAVQSMMQTAPKSPPLTEILVQEELNLVFVPVTIKGREFSFLLDTGFQYSAVDADVARNLELTIGHVANRKVPGGSIDQAWVENVAFSLGSVRHSPNRSAVISLAGIAPVLGRRVDGILGHDV